MLQIIRRKFAVINSENQLAVLDSLRPHEL